MPRLYFSQTSQRLTALTNAVFSGSLMTTRACSESDGLSAYHQRSRGVSSRILNSLAPASQRLPPCPPEPCRSPERSKFSRPSTRVPGRGQAIVARLPPGPPALLPVSPSRSHVPGASSSAPGSGLSHSRNCTPRTAHLTDCGAHSLPQQHRIAPASGYPRQVCFALKLPRFWPPRRLRPPRSRTAGHPLAPPGNIRPFPPLRTLRDEMLASCRLTQSGFPRLLRNKPA